MNASSDEHDERIDRHLREANQQIRLRPEFLENVLNKVSQELTKLQTNPPVQVQPYTMFASPLARFWMKLGSVAAIVMIALTWIYIQPAERELSNVPGQGTKVKSEPRVLDEMARQIMESKPGEPSSINGANGYLAAKLFEDAEFEVYVVLPTIESSTEHVR